MRPHDPPAQADPRRLARKADFQLGEADDDVVMHRALQVDGRLVEPAGNALRRELRRLYGVYELDPVWREHNGRGVRVAVLDTGLAFDHPLLKDAVARDERTGRPICRLFVRDELAARRLRSEDTEGDPALCADRDGHGTHCAGVIAARDLGAEACPGIAPGCSLIIGKVLDDKGQGHLDDLADAIVWAASRADIISLSISAPETTDRLFRAIHAALAVGCTIVCAAGNSGRIPGELAYPARYGAVISVAAHDRYGEPVRFSSRGGEIDFAALGQDVWSTSVDEHGRPTLARASGTSIAAPVVSGIAALILAKHREFDRRYGDSGDRRFENRTPIRNAEDMRAHLLAIAYTRSGHRDDLGYGPLWPNRLLSA